MVHDRARHQDLQSVVTEGAELPVSHLGSFAQSDHHPLPEGEAPTICGDVLKAARAQSKQLTSSTTDSSRDRRMRLEAMLGVVSYCYMKGVFDSGEIERRLWQDTAFLATFGGETPTAQTIRCFRREYRTAIMATIERALCEFRQRTAMQAPVNRPDASPPVSDAMHSKANHLLNMASIMDQLNRER